MNNAKGYGLIDDLTFGYNGNRRTKVTDAITEQLTYEGCFDFVDGTNTGNDYAYNANGALTKDQNKGITKIEYDLLGNPKKVTIYINNRTHSDNRFIEYIYSADGRRLKTIHSRYIGTPSGGGCVATDTASYFGNLILENGKPEMYRFSGGYYDFKDDGSLNDSHYYIADYMGNNRMVVNGRTGAVEQINHYYPYGGVIGNLSSNEALQAFKFEDKELDRTYGLDWYDIQARQYDAAAPTWNAPDPLAEKYYRFSPYNFCMGNPINFGDYNGMEGNNTAGYYTEDPDEFAKIFKTYQSLYGNSRTEQEEDGTAYNVKSTYMGYEIGIGIPNPHPTSQDRPIMVADFETNELLYDISLSTELGFIHDWTVKSLDEWNSLDGKSKRELAENIYKNQRLKFYSSITNVTKKYPQHLTKAKGFLGPITMVANMGENIADVYANKRIGIGNALDATMTAIGVWGGPIGSAASLAYFVSDVVLYYNTNPSMHIRDYLNSKASINFNK